MKAITTGNKLGEIVADDFRSAAIFKSAGIDFCCGGNKSIGEACKEKGIDAEKLVQDLQSLESQKAVPGQNFNEWDLKFLADYIVNIHHSFVKKNLPDLVFYTRKIASVHGENHSELLEVADLFGRISSELTQHLRMEEEVLFPAIARALVNRSDEDVRIIKSEIARMSGEHEFAGGAMDRINQITNGYLVPEDGCNTYRVAFRLLEQFEDDLHVHVHLENNILYPKSLKL